MNELQQFNIKIFPVVTDVSKSKDVKNAVDAAVKSLGRIDILVNGAGINMESKMHELAEENWDKVLNVNLKSVYLFNKEVANHMIEKKIRGKIITISSMSGKTGEYGFGAYGCTKSAINTITQAMALELAEYGINVNAVSPGYINTDMLKVEFREMGSREGITAEEYEKRLCDSLPFKRMGEAREVGELITFLASGSANYITGMSYTIAGGVMLQ